VGYEEDSKGVGHEDPEGVGQQGDKDLDGVG
jgi:hypothetical protein